MECCGQNPKCSWRLDEWAVTDRRPLSTSLVVEGESNRSGWGSRSSVRSGKVSLLWRNRVELVFEYRHGNKRMKNVKEVLMKWDKGGNENIANSQRRFKTVSPKTVSFSCFVSFPFSLPSVVLRTAVCTKQDSLNVYFPSDVMVPELIFWRISLHWTSAARSKRPAPTLESVCRNPTNPTSLPVPGRVKNVASPSPPWHSPSVLPRVPGCRWILHQGLCFQWVQTHTSCNSQEGHSPTNSFLTFQCFLCPSIPNHRPHPHPASLSGLFQVKHLTHTPPSDSPRNAFH